MNEPGAKVFHSTRAGEGFLHAHLSAVPASGAAEEAREAYGSLAERMKSGKIEPISEKVYGALDARGAVLDARRAAYEARGLDPSLPLTYLEGRPAGGGRFAGVQIWGVAGRGSRGPGVETVPAGSSTARLWSAPDFRLLHVPAVSGLALPPERAPDVSSPGPRAQAEAMFRRVLDAGRRHCFGYRDAARTWIYLRRILDWYGELNRVRNALYAQPDFLGGDSSLFPASTGIQGRAGEEECLMDALFLSSGSSPARRIQKTARQEPSCAYGSAFSRGACLGLDRRRLVHVSGTASIGSGGESLHPGDAQAQSRETLDAVSAVLRTEGAGLSDIVSSTLFCKDAGAYEGWKRALRRAGSPEFPAVAVLADVCRPELLVELEAVAVV